MTLLQEQWLLVVLFNKVTKYWKKKKKSGFVHLALHW